MDSTVIRSPPTSRAIDARSSVVVITFNLPCARAGRVAMSSIPARAATDVLMVITHLPTTPVFPLERMGAVCANGELELEQELMSGRALGVIGESILTAHLTELARPIR